MKYEAFNDPVVVCDGCAEFILLEEIKKVGGCPECGKKRVREIRVINDENLAKVNRWIREGKIEKEWLNLFEEVQ